MNYRNPSLKSPLGIKTFKAFDEGFKNNCCKVKYFFRNLRMKCIDIIFESPDKAFSILHKML